MTEQKKNEDYKKLSFEKALEKLDGIVSRMESGKLPLDEMMKYFEEGSTLSKVCENKLKEIEKKIEVLVRKTENGGEWKEFSAENTRSTSTRKTKSTDEKEDVEEKKNETDGAELF